MVLYIVHVVVLLCTEFLRTMYRENKILYKLVFDKISVLYCNMALSMTFFPEKIQCILLLYVTCILMLKEAGHIHSKHFLLFRHLSVFRTLCCLILILDEVICIQCSILFL